MMLLFNALCSLIAFMNGAIFIKLGRAPTTDIILIKWKLDLMKYKIPGLLQKE
jgi:hypothetical protein